jgi:hypothetical protein
MLCIRRISRLSILIDKFQHTFREPKVVSRSRPVRATLNYNPVNDGVESCISGEAYVGGAPEHPWKRWQGVGTDGTRVGIGVVSGMRCRQCKWCRRDAVAVPIMHSGPGAGN